MAMNKSETINAFHNMLSMQIKNLQGDKEAVEFRPDNNTSLFRFYTETEGLTYVVQTQISIVDNEYNVNVMIIEENQREETHELIDEQNFRLRDLSFNEKGVKLVHKYIRGMVKAMVIVDVPVFDNSEEEN